MVRWLTLVVVVGTLAMPAAAAGVDPRAIVLGQRDVPDQYTLDRDNSLFITRATVAHSSDGAARRLRGVGFVAGYSTRYVNSDPPRWRYVDSAAYLFTEARGAKAFLAYLRSAAARGVIVGRAELGDEAWLFSSRSVDTGTAMFWRHGRVVAWVSCREMTAHRTLAVGLARKQERRIAARLT